MVLLNHQRRGLRGSASSALGRTDAERNIRYRNLSRLVRNVELQEQSTIICKGKTMTAKSQLISYLAPVLIIAGNPICMLTHAGDRGVEASLDWSIETPKGSYYPGEPILLTMNIRNSGQREETIYFGPGGIGAFSFEIHDNANKILAKGDRILRGGQSSQEVIVLIPPGKIGRKSIVLNRWCSTRLPPSEYNLVCDVEYLLRSEATRIVGTQKGFKAGPPHQTQLRSTIEIIKGDDNKYKEILRDLAEYEMQKQEQPLREWLKEREIARNMIAFTEWEVAVPYQLRIFRIESHTALRWDIVDSLVRSKTLEAALGLMEIMEDSSVYKEDVEPQIIAALHTLREMGKPDIIEATHEFVRKYKRPVLTKPID